MMRIASPSRSRGESLAGMVNSPRLRRHRGSDSDVPRTRKSDAEYNASFANLARPLIAKKKSAVAHTMMEGLDRMSAVKLAAVYVKDGVHGRTVTHKTDPYSLRRYHIYHGKPWHGFVVLVGFGLLMLATVEPTANWLRDEKLDLGIIFLLEMAGLLVFVGDIALQLSFTKRKSWFKSKWMLVKMATVSLLCIGAIMAFAFPTWPRLIRCLRPLLVMERLANVRKIFTAMLESVPHIFTAVVLLIFHIFIFGLFAFVLYAGIRDGECNVQAQPTYTYCSVFSKDCTDYFSRIIDSMLHLFTLITTANYPDVMMPAYDCSTWNALFFITFETFGLYFLLSLVLAVTYTHFQEKTKEKVITRLRRRVTGLTMAFTTLAGPRAMYVPTKRRRSPRSAIRKAMGSGPASTGKKPKPTPHQEDPIAAAAEARAHLMRKGSRTNLSFSAYVSASEEDDRVSGVVKWSLWLQLMRELRPDLSSDFLAILFDIVDADHDGQITLSEFQHLASLAEVDVEEISLSEHDRDTLRRCEARLYHLRKRVRAVVYATYSVFFWDLLVLCSCGFLLYQSIMKWDASPDTKRHLHYVETGFLFTFVVELVLKTFALGLGRFWRDSVFNKVDFIAIVGAATSSLIIEVIMGETHSPVIQGFYFMRMLRLLRTLRTFGQFRVMITSFVDILPAMCRYLMVAMATYYVFAIIGMQLFSHKFVRGKIVGTAFFKNDYWKNNFDTFHTTMVVLFELMIVNNWPINMEAAVKATGTWARWFYLAWYFVAVIVVINVLVAFLLDSFSTRKALNESKELSMQYIWTNLFNLSCERLGYNPERWQVVRRLKIGDLYEAMYQSDLQDDPLFRASGRGSLQYQSRRHEVPQDKYGDLNSEDADEYRAVLDNEERNVAHGGKATKVIRRSQTTVKVGNPRTPTLGANQSTSERIRTPPSGHSRPVTSARTRNEDEGGGDIDARGRLPRGVQAMNVTFGSHSPTFPMDSSVAEDQSVDGSHAPLLRELTTEQLVLELTRRQRQSSTHSLQMPMSSLLPEKMRSAALHASGGMHSVAEEDDEKQSREP